MIEILSIVYEILALRNELLALRVGNVNIEAVSSLNINNRRNMVIKGSYRTKEIFTKEDVFNLSQDTIEQILKIPFIVKNEAHKKKVT